jgi:hypothetical protein
VTVTDTGGVNTITCTFTVVVDAVNDIPVFTGGPGQTVFAGGGAGTVLGWATNLRGSAR